LTGVSEDEALPPDLARGTPKRAVPRELPAWLRQTPGEQRWPSACAILVAIGLQAGLLYDLPSGHFVWLIIGEALLFVVVAIGNPVRMENERRELRVAGLSLVGLASAGTVWLLVVLVDRLVSVGDLPAGHLLRWGAATWLTNVIVFALWYWEFDRGGPVARAMARRPQPDFLFSQMTVPELIHKDWEPAFVDYLYLSFTNATAFSPTDTLPLSRWAKLTMMVESAVSLVTVALIVARAVNVIGAAR
jgi:uncharacterized membrane protein